MVVCIFKSSTQKADLQSEFWGGQSYEKRPSLKQKKQTKKLTESNHAAQIILSAGPALKGGQTPSGHTLREIRILL